MTDKIKTLLANFLGVEADDIKDEYSLADDLHMTPTDLTDFVESLKTEGIDVSTLDLTQTETFEELIENLTEHQ